LAAKKSAGKTEQEGFGLEELVHARSFNTGITSDHTELISDIRMNTDDHFVSIRMEQRKEAIDRYAEDWNTLATSLLGTTLQQLSSDQVNHINRTIREFAAMRVQADFTLEDILRYQRVSSLHR
jgi:hypothetical protein